MHNSNGKNIALVLSSGGARGFAHIGVIEELINHGYSITSISGTSMGAIVGGMYVAGQLTDFKKWVCSLDKKAVFDLLDFTLSTSGMIKGERVFEALKKIIVDRKIEQLPIPYCAVATDIIHCKEIVFREGSLFDAMKASSSIPTLIIPFALNDLMLVDGGVLNPVPINHVIRNKNDLLVVVNVNANTCNDKFNFSNNSSINKNFEFENNHESNGKYQNHFIRITKKNGSFFSNNKHEHLSYIELLKKSISLMISQISKLTIDQYKPDILINVSYNSFGIYDFHKSVDIIDLGARMAREVLEKKIV